MFHSVYRHRVYATLVVAAVALLIAVGLMRQARAATFDCSWAIGVPVPECEALVDLYNSMHGDEWYQGYLWLYHRYVCTWYGVTCTDGHVTALNLSFNESYGEIPASIGDLTSLVSLTIYRVAGVLPAELSALTNLTHLTLGGYYEERLIEGPLPDLSALRKLESLRISYTSIGGPVPSWINQTNFPNLTVLMLSANRFTGPVPSTLTSMTGLVDLRLDRNSLTGPFPDFSATCDTLGVFWIGGDADTYEAAPFPAWLNGQNCPNLHSIWIEKSNFTGPFPDLSSMPLKGLVLINNHFDPGPIPSSLVNMPDLQHIELSNTMREGELPELWASAPILNFLLLDNNRLTGGIPATYNRTNYPEFGIMNFNNNQLTSIHPNFATFNDGPYGPAGALVALNSLIPSSLAPDVQAFLDAENPGWRTRQIVPPDTFSAAPTADGAEVTVTPIDLNTDFAVAYRVDISTTPGGPYTVAGSTTTAPGTTTPVTITVNGLEPGTQYYYVVRSVVFADDGGAPVTNAYDRLSPPSAEHRFTTTAKG